MYDTLKYYAKNNVITDLFYRKISLMHDIKENELLDLYNIRFIKLFKHAYKYSSFYNDLYGSHGISVNDIKDLTDLTKLPVIRRSDIKNKIDEIFNGNNIFKIKSYTSGTSGSPLTVFRTIASINVESAYLRYFRFKHGFKRGQPLVSIRGYLDKNSLYKFEKYSNTLYISSPNINSDNIDLFHSLILKFNPKAIEAFPSYLYKFYIELSSKKLKLDIPLAFTSSEMLYDFQRVKLENYFNAKIYDWYGNVERTIGLVQYKYNEYSSLPLYSINEFTKNSVITSSLNNFSFPLIRYAVDDIIEVKSDNFLNNIVSPEILKINGRVGDTIDLKDGSQVSCIDHAFKGIKNLQMAQLHQNDVLNPLLVKLVVENDFTINDENQLRHNLIKMIGNNMTINFKYCNKEDLTCLSNDKFKLIVKNI